MPRGVKFQRIVCLRVGKFEDLSIEVKYNQIIICTKLESKFNRRIVLPSVLAAFETPESDGCLAAP